MENNFPDWIKKHPGSTFENYKLTVCVTENQTVEPPPPPKPIRKYWLYLAGFAIAFTLFYAVGQLAGESIAHYIKSVISSQHFKADDWKRENYGTFGLSIETPVRLVKSDLPLPDNIRQFIDIMDVYKYGGNNFAIMINSARYKPEIGSLDLLGAANGSVSEMKAQQGVSDFNYSQDPFSISDLPGIIQRGTYMHNGEAVEFINAIFLNGLVYYQILIAYQPDDQKRKSAAEKIIASIEFQSESKQI